MNPKRTFESGFTILELIIAIALIAILVTACLMGVRLATASREEGTQRTDLYQRLRVIHERLHTTLGSAHFIFVPVDSESLIPEENEAKADETKILAFEGKPESLKFVTFSDKLMAGDASPWMHEVRFYLQKNADTGHHELLMNERDFSPKDFFKQDSLESKAGQTLILAQDVVYLKFRYYKESPKKEKNSDSTEDKPVKSSGEWTDKIITEPIDFKSKTVSDKNADKNKESVVFPRAVEVSVGLLKQDLLETGEEQSIIELPPTIITIQVGRTFGRLEKAEGDAIEE